MVSLLLTISTISYPAKRKQYFEEVYMENGIKAVLNEYTGLIQFFIKD
jgi:hypothetical protein